MIQGEENWTVVLHFIDFKLGISTTEIRMVVCIVWFFFFLFMPVFV